MVWGRDQDMVGEGTALSRVQHGVAWALQTVLGMALGGRESESCTYAAAITVASRS